MERGSTGDNVYLCLMNQQISLLWVLQLPYQILLVIYHIQKADFEGARDKGSSGNFVSTGVGRFNCIRPDSSSRERFSN